jgi:DNA gyrase subunit A
MGRTATGVRGMKLMPGEQVMSLIIAEGDADILTATARGYGKRTPLDEYPKKGRGTQGVIAIQCSERNGSLVAAVQIDSTHELMLISNQGTLVRTRAAEIARVGRNTQGVTLIRLPADESLVGVVKVDSFGEGDEDDAGSANDGAPAES